MRSDNPKNNKNVMESMKTNKNVATSDLSESAGSRLRATEMGVKGFIQTCESACAKRLIMGEPNCKTYELLGEICPECPRHYSEELEGWIQDELVKIPSENA